jgi:superoxide dismutase, Fe-Mn family
MAHNNAFFFSAITPEPKPMSAELKKDLEDSFGSIETLQREFIVTASSMFGPGFVWLVKSRDRKYSLLCTYLAGSPYPGAHYRRQPVDMNTEDKTVAEAIRRSNSWEPVNTVGSHGPQSQKKMAPGGIDLSPILCINMWEHVYLPDYGGMLLIGRSSGRMLKLGLSKASSPEKGGLRCSILRAFGHKEICVS